LADLAILPFPPNGHGRPFWYVPTFLLKKYLGYNCKPQGF
jgi:hypothetical protein